MESKKIARLYTRVSTAEQRKKDTSCKDQEAYLKDYCKKNGFVVAGRPGKNGKPTAYTDNGFSGGKMDRPAFIQLLEDVQPGETVIVTFVDRLSRTLYGAIPIIQEWKEKGVHFLATHEPQLTMDTPDGEFFLNLSLSIAQKERQRVGERIRFSFEQKRERGERLCGNVALGYRISEDSKGVEVDPKGQEIVNFTFEHFVATRNVLATYKAVKEKYGNDLKKIYTELHKSGNPYPSEITNKRINYMLRNKKYLGDEIFPQIVNTSLFEQAQEILEKRAVRTSKKHDYIFTGLVICGGCGHHCAGNTAYVRKSRKPEITDKREYKCYRCTTTKRGDQTDDCVCISEKKLERIVLNELEEEMKKTNISETLTKEKIQDAEESIKKCKAKLKRIGNAYIDDMISREYMLEQKKKINDEIRRLEKSLDADKNITLDISSLEAYHNLSTKDKNLFWLQLVKTIRVYKGGKISIEWAS